MDAARARRALLVAVAAGLALFLFVQPGNPYDEAEHLHAAWLIAARGMHPVRDFFEHHPPLLWDVLALLFRAGIAGPEVLYAARALVVACVAAFAWGAFAVARRTPAPDLPGAFAFLLLALVATIAQQLFVARPETLATGLLGLALVLWTRRGVASATFSGALFALCLAASPRFIMLAPVFLLAGEPGRRRLAAAAAGGLAAFGAFLALLCPWRELLFDLRFSALLQRVGLAPEVFSLIYLAGCAAGGAFLAGMAWSTRRIPARAAALWGAYGAVVWAVCFLSAGRFLYAQAFAPGLLWAVLFTAWLDAQPAAEGSPSTRPVLLSLALTGALLAIALQVGASSLNAYNVFSQTVSRRMLLSRLPAGASVFLMPEVHPITADDAGYYGALLSVGICDAAEAYPQEYPGSAVRVPGCDFLGDLRRARPAAVSRNLYLASRALGLDALRAEIAAGYEITDALDDAPNREFSANVMFRRR
ncbi:MAG TPA: hypothetical protein VLW85_19820 [Myxococcales bacterium]|nr:hypothetical protein [Myxococcales bacterium]